MQYWVTCVASGTIERTHMSREGTILVTGGAGYIGSHVVLQLVEAGE